MEQGDRGGVVKYLEMGKMEGGSETPVLRELNPPKNSKIPQKNKEITTKGSYSLPSSVLESGEEMRVKG
jgi:hypothetical protein